MSEKLKDMELIESDSDDSDYVPPSDSSESESDDEIEGLEEYIDECLGDLIKNLENYIREKNLKT